MHNVGVLFFFFVVLLDSLPMLLGKVVNDGGFFLLGLLGNDGGFGGWLCRG